VKLDYGQAYFWIDLAAEGKVDEGKQECLGKARDAVASNLTAEELSQVQERVRTWLQAHTAQTAP
jgi:hypothetical protein